MEKSFYPWRVEVLSLAEKLEMLFLMKILFCDEVW